MSIDTERNTPSEMADLAQGASGNPKAVPEELRLPDLSTYAGYAKAVHEFAVSLAERTADMDKQVAGYSMTPQMKASTTAMMIEGFVNTVIQTRLKVIAHHDRQATIKEVVERVREESPFNRTRVLSTSPQEAEAYMNGFNMANAQWRAALKKIEEEM